MKATRLKAFLFGIAAAAIAFAVLAGMRAISPPSAWVNLLFRLFPEPAIIECARLIMLFALGAALRDKGAWLLSAAGFVVFGAAAALASHGDFAIGSLIFALAAAALQAVLTVIAFAMLQRQAAPFLIYCALALLHGAHNGGLLAFERVAPPLSVMIMECGLTITYAALTLFLLRRSNAVRGEDRSFG